mmetsp:Transcript_76746/g.239047  ORF Transcript_76746/g.239047 Transcript_76746/m.239047 type:complete len:217 (+) Transcript_76746:220-870(+)
MATSRARAKSSKEGIAAAAPPACPPLASPTLQTCRASRHWSSALQNLLACSATCGHPASESATGAESRGCCRGGGSVCRRCGRNCWGVERTNVARKTRSRLLPPACPCTGVCGAGAGLQVPSTMVRASPPARLPRVISTPSMGRAASSLGGAATGGGVSGPVGQLAAALPSCGEAGSRIVGWWLPASVCGICVGEAGGGISDSAEGPATQAPSLGL